MPTHSPPHASRPVSHETFYPGAIRELITTLLGPGDRIRDTGASPVSMPYLPSLNAGTDPLGYGPRRYLPTNTCLHWTTSAANEQCSSKSGQHDAISDPLRPSRTLLSYLGRYHGSALVQNYVHLIDFPREAFSNGSCRRAAILDSHTLVLTEPKA
jgi:hypothetical protein